MTSCNNVGGSSSSAFSMPLTPRKKRTSHIKLIEQNKYEALFSEITRQIERQGLKVKNASVAIVDATLITTNARPNSVYHENPKGELEKEL